MAWVAGQGKIRLVLVGDIGPGVLLVRLHPLGAKSGVVIRTALTRRGAVQMIVYVKLVQFFRPRHLNPDRPGSWSPELAELMCHDSQTNPRLSRFLFEAREFQKKSN